LPPTPSSPDADLRRRRIALLAMGPVIIVIVGALLFVSIRSSHHKHLTAKVSGTFLVGGAAPTFRATDLDGHPFSLASLRGRAVIVAFGASWCNPCHEEYPLLVKAAAKYADKLVVVSVMHDDLVNDERAFLGKYHVKWAAIDDNSNAISHAYRVKELPDTFFITPSGKVLTRVFGLTSQDLMDDPLNRLLATG
jgi:thiol-disulfide isomerase/thioredoxin